MIQQSGTSAANSQAYEEVYGNVQCFLPASCVEFETILPFNLNYAGTIDLFQDKIAGVCFAQVVQCITRA